VKKEEKGPLSKLHKTSPIQPLLEHFTTTLILKKGGGKRYPPITKQPIKS
jgi:hypothetical protein